MDGVGWERRRAGAAGTVCQEVIGTEVESETRWFVYTVVVKRVVGHDDMSSTVCLYLFLIGSRVYAWVSCLSLFLCSFFSRCV